MSPVSEAFNEAKERIKNPFAGAVIISFVLFNWRIFAHLFLSDASVNDRLQAIDNMDIWIYSPLGTALGYVLLMPWVLVVIERVRQFGTDNLIQVQRSQEPRVTLRIKFKEEKITLRDALDFVKPGSSKKLTGAVSDCKKVVQVFIKQTEKELTREKKTEFYSRNKNLDDAFTELLGTPLELILSDPESNEFASEES